MALQTPDARPQKGEGRAARPPEQGKRACSRLLLPAPACPGLGQSAAGEAAATVRMRCCVCVCCCFCCFCFRFRNCCFIRRFSRCCFSHC